MRGTPGISSYSSTAKIMPAYRSATRSLWRSMNFRVSGSWQSRSGERSNAHPPPLSALGKRSSPRGGRQRGARPLRHALHPCVLPCYREPPASLGCSAEPSPADVGHPRLTSCGRSGVPSPLVGITTDRHRVAASGATAPWTRRVRSVSLPCNASPGVRAASAAPLPERQMPTNTTGRPQTTAQAATSPNGVVCPFPGALRRPSRRGCGRGTP